MTLSKELPPFYQSWNEFHNDLIKAELPGEVLEIYWYHAYENRGIITRGSLRDHDQKRYSVRYIEQQALAELKERLKVQTFSMDDYFYLRKGLTWLMSDHDSVKDVLGDLHDRVTQAMRDLRRKAT